MNRNAFIGSSRCNDRTVQFIAGDDEKVARFQPIAEILNVIFHVAVQEPVNFKSVVNM